ncbi:hypothetical protein LPJ70_003911, partial [Coemansia sp. RSA 2708]
MSGFEANGAGASAGGSDARPEEYLNFSQAASMFMGSSGDSGLEDLWGMGDATNMFFNMDAFSSAPGSAGGNPASSAPTAPSSSVAATAAAQATGPADGGQADGGVDLSTLGFDVGGASMDAEAWKMLLQGDPSMDELFGGSGGGFGSGGGTVSAVAAPTAQVPPGAAAGTGTLAPADLDALNRQQMPPPPAVKSPTPSAKKPRQPKPKKAASAKGEKTKSKAKKAATPKLKSPTPSPATGDAGMRGGPASPASDTMRRIKPKGDGASVASPTPSAKSITAQH